MEIETFGTFSVVAYLVALRFLIATALVAVVFPKARAGLRLPVIWKGGGILGGLMLVGFVSQMVALNDINPSTSAFLTSLYVVMTAVLTLWMSDQAPRRALYWGVLMATVGGLYADLDNECIAAPELPDVNLNATRGGCRAYVATQAC